MPGKRSLKALCGKYEHPENADFCVGEIFGRREASQS